MVIRMETIIKGLGFSGLGFNQEVWGLGLVCKV